MTELPIKALIDERSRDLGLSRQELVVALGYANIAKGVRRLRSVEGGDFEHAGHLMASLPNALQVPPETLVAAIQATTDVLGARAREACRRSFKPHAIIRTERTIPSQTTLAAFTHAERLLLVPLDTGQPRATWVRQALVTMNVRLRQFGGVIPFFGKPVGLTVAFTAERTAHYDCEGRLLKLTGAVGEGRCELRW
ncbi:hypothetical protein JNW90_28970 [Micromonospora sp. STR1s_5]|nr:hypothetical protein [Micromonospora sp. STR1s_5]